MSRLTALAALVAITLAFASAGASSAGARQVSWAPFHAAPGDIDVVGPRSDGRMAVAMYGGIQLFDGSKITPFTYQTGPGAYSPAIGEPYLAVTPKVRLPKSNCSFHRDEIFALDYPVGIKRISRFGFASDFAAPSISVLSGVTFDRVGTFGHRLVTTGTVNGQTTLYAVDCRGGVTTVSEHGPLVEGGIEVAPRTFGRFGGSLIAPDETTGAIYAFKPNGSTATVAIPSLLTGGDIGVESVGFVPRLGPNGAAFLADRSDQAQPHPGTGSILRLTAAQLKKAGVAAGDLLVATEGGAETVAVRCRTGKKSCRVRVVGPGPSVAHAEGHISFLGALPPKTRR
jgi:hypothetical protein